MTYTGAWVARQACFFFKVLAEGSIDLCQLHCTFLVVIVHLDIWSPFRGIDVEIATAVPVERGVVVVVSSFSIARSVRAVNVG